MALTGHPSNNVNGVAGYPHHDVKGPLTAVRQDCATLNTARLAILPPRSIAVGMSLQPQSVLIKTRILPCERDRRSVVVTPCDTWCQEYSPISSSCITALCCKQAHSLLGWEGMLLYIVGALACVQKPLSHNNNIAMSQGCEWKSRTCQPCSRYSSFVHLKLHLQPCLHLQFKSHSFQLHENPLAFCLNCTSPAIQLGVFLQGNDCVKSSSHKQRPHRAFRMQQVCRSDARLVQPRPLQKLCTLSMTLKLSEKAPTKSMKENTGPRGVTRPSLGQVMVVRLHTRSYGQPSMTDE